MVSGLAGRTRDRRGSVTDRQYASAIRVAPAGHPALAEAGTLTCRLLHQRMKLGDGGDRRCQGWRRYNLSPARGSTHGITKVRGFHDEHVAC